MNNTHKIVQNTRIELSAKNVGSEQIYKQKNTPIWELFFVTYSFSDFLFFALRRTRRLVTNLYVLFINLLT